MWKLFLLIYRLHYGRFADFVIQVRDYNYYTFRNESAQLPPFHHPPQTFGLHKDGWMADCCEQMG